jgi:hypothetical protein
VEIESSARPLFSLVDSERDRRRKGDVVPMPRVGATPLYAGALRGIVRRVLDLKDGLVPAEVSEACIDEALGIIGHTKAHMIAAHPPLVG